MLKQSSGWESALQYWGRDSVDVGVAGVLPQRSGCNSSTAASAWGCHGLVKLKVNLPGTQIFQWLLLVPGLLPPLSGPMGHCGWASYWSCCWSVQLNGWRQCPGLGGGSRPFPGWQEGEAKHSRPKSLPHVLLVSVSVPCAWRATLPHLLLRCVGTGVAGECCIAPPCPRCTAV